MDWSLTILDEEGDVSFVVVFETEDEAIDARDEFLKACPEVDAELVSVGQNAELSEAIEFYQ